MFGDMGAVVAELAKVKDALNENTKAVMENTLTLIETKQQVVALNVTLKGIWQQAKTHLE